VTGLGGRGEAQRGGSAGKAITSRYRLIELLQLRGLAHVSGGGGATWPPSAAFTPKR
jgi:hypothetical protein